MNTAQFIAKPQLEDYVSTDTEARAITNRIIEAL